MERQNQSVSVVKYLRIIPITNQTTTFANIQHIINAWLLANTKSLPGIIVEMVINLDGAWKIQDESFKIPKTLAADVDKHVPVLDGPKQLAIASVSGTVSGTIELYIENT